jgi:hypothetical protein
MRTSIAKALLVSFTKLTKSFFVPGHKAKKSDALLSFQDLTGQYRPSCAAIYKSTKSAIATGHFSFFDPPLQSQSNIYACETESDTLKKRIF